MTHGHTHPIQVKGLQGTGGGAPLLLVLLLLRWLLLLLLLRWLLLLLLVCQGGVVCPAPLCTPHHMLEMEDRGGGSVCRAQQVTAPEKCKQSLGP